MSIREQDDEQGVARGQSAGPVVPDAESDSPPETQVAAGSDDTQTPSAVMPAWRARLQSIMSVDGVWFGLAAVALGIHAQLILTPNGRPDPHADSVSATRWYLLAVAVLIIGWAEGYTNHSLLTIPRQATRGLRGWLAPDTFSRSRRDTWLVSAAIAVNLLALLVLRGNWYSLVGGLLWVGSIGLLIAGYAGERSAAVPGEGSRPVTRFWTRTRVIETVALAAILGLALALRLWRLGDLLPGMHGDEGEAGTQGLAILNGDLVSPFMRGWFNQSNVYYWSLAIAMKLFGTGLFGLRSFALICGMLTVLFTYLITREMFGVRAAILAGLFISFQSAALLFSRQEFSNVTIPPLEAATFYFLVRGLRTRRHLDFALAGLIGGFAVYYFAGGRLIVPVAAMFLAYLALLHRSFLRAYWTRALAFFLGVFTIASPFAAYYLAYPLPTNTYPNDRFIWLNHDQLAALYGSSNWSTIVWDQTTRTFSILTSGIDLSAMSALDFPIARPFEAVLIILGLAWSIWRWRDTRYFLLSLWFWTSLFIGGVLTTDAPNLPRILGILPVMAILIAIILDRIWRQITVVGYGSDNNRTWGRLALWGGGVLVALVALVSGIQNKQLYIDSWLNEHTNTIVTGQALYVQNHGLRYHYYDMGAPIIYWTHGDNRFINPQALLQGEDAVNLSSNLPILDNGPTGEQDADFMVWPNEYDYLKVLQAYYPEGTEHSMRLGDPAHLTQPLIGFTVSHQAIDRHRTLLARYQSASGKSISRREPRIGLAVGALPPPGLRYPVQASWTGGLVAPTYGTYSFQLQAPAHSRLTIDGVQVFPASGKTSSIILAQGPHTIRLSAQLSGPQTPVAVTWSGLGIPDGPIDRRYLWDNHIGRAWLGESQPAASPPSSRPATPVAWRVDGFLGFRSSSLALEPGVLAPNGLLDRWTSVLTVRQAGTYGFELNSFGNSSLLVDGKSVVNDVAPGPDPNLANGQVHLSAGTHRLELRYSWQVGTGYLELSWQPPNEPLQFFVTPDLHPPAPAAWHPGSPGAPRVAPPPPIPPAAESPGSSAASGSAP